MGASWFETVESGDCDLAYFNGSLKAGAEDAESSASTCYY